MQRIQDGAADPAHLAKPQALVARTR